MLIPQLNEATGELMAKVGAGRQCNGDNGELLLTFCQQPAASGLLLHARLNDRPVCFWLDEQQWCQWIAPVLTLPSLNMLPEALQEIVTGWTLAAANPYASDADFPWPHAERLIEGNVAAGMAWRLSIRCDDRQLDLRAVGESESWLNALLDYTVPAVAEKQLLPITLNASLLAGWSLVNGNLPDALRPGDALLLQRQWDIANGRFLLFTHQPIASLYQERESGLFNVENLMENFDDWMDITPSSAPAASMENTLADMLIPVTVEVAQLQVTLEELSQLEVGSQLSGIASQNTLVTLKAGGRPFARGTLLQIGDRLAVRIEQRY